MSTNDGWVVYRNRKAPAVTVMKSGAFTLNTAARAALGIDSRVMVLVDNLASPDRVMFRYPTPEEEPLALNVSKSGTVTARQLVEAIKATESLRYYPEPGFVDVERGDGQHYTLAVLVIDFTQPGEVVTRSSKASAS